jgi:hypothetical protein
MYLIFFVDLNLDKRDGDGINTASSPNFAKPKSLAKATPTLTRITTPKDTGVNISSFLLFIILEEEKVLVILFIVFKFLIC